MQKSFAFILLVLFAGGIFFVPQTAGAFSFKDTVGEAVDFFPASVALVKDSYLSIGEGVLSGVDSLAAGASAGAYGFVSMNAAVGETVFGFVGRSIDKVACFLFSVSCPEEQAVVATSTPIIVQNIINEYYATSTVTQPEEFPVYNVYNSSTITPVGVTLEVQEYVRKQVESILKSNRRNRSNSGGSSDSDFDHDGMTIANGTFTNGIFSGDASFTTFEVTGTGTSTFAGGINLTGGCFAVNGSCVTGTGGSGSVNSGTAGYFGYYPASGTTIDDQAVLYTDGTNVGVGTTALTHTFVVNGTVAFRPDDDANSYFTLDNFGRIVMTSGDSGAAGANNRVINFGNDEGYYGASAEYFSIAPGDVDDSSYLLRVQEQNVSYLSVLGSGKVIVGSAPTSTASMFTVAGTATVQNLVSTSSATSTFGGGIDIATGCFAINGVCVGTGGGTGSVTSVGLTAPTGFSVSNSPITSTGNLNLSYAAGYEGLLTASSSNWNTFYNTPSTRIAAGKGLGWSGNTLSVLVGIDTAASIGQIPYYSSTATLTPTSTIFISPLSYVGLGTLNPVAKLHVSITDATDNPSLRIENGNSSGDASMLLAPNGATWSVGAHGSAASVPDTFFINKEASTNSFVISGNEFVGIGTSTPYAKLSVAGDLAVTGGIYDSTASRGVDGLILQSTGTGVQWVATSTLNINLATSTIRQSISENLAALDYDSSAGLLSLAAGYNIPLTASTTNWNSFYDTPSARITPGTGLSWAGNTLNAQVSQWNTNGAAISYSLGNVGIGTTSPSFPLTVIGSFHVDGGIYDNNMTRGTAGAVLTSTSNGLQWVATSSLGFATSSTQFSTSTARQAISEVIDAINYDSSTGLFSLSPSYLIPLTASTTNWNIFYDTPSTRISAGSGLVWTGNSLSVNASTSSQWTTNGDDIYYNVGNVGIGTTSPYAKLSVNGTVLASNFVATGTATSTFAGSIDVTGGCLALNGVCLQASGTVNAGTLYQVPYYSSDGTAVVGTSTLQIINGSVAVGGTTTPKALFSIASATSTNLFDISTTSNPIIRVLSNGNVGIGTDNPQYTLDIKGPAAPSLMVGNAGGTFGSIYLGNIGSGFIRNYVGDSTAAGLFTSGNLYISANGSSETRHIFLANNGNVGIGTGGSVSEKLIVSGSAVFGGFVRGSYFLATTTNAASILAGGLYVGTTSTSGFGGADIFAVGTSTSGSLFSVSSTTGNVGIGTTSPYSKLSVNGQVVASNFVATNTTATSTLSGGVTIGGATNYGFTVLQNGFIGAGGSRNPRFPFVIQDGGVGLVLGADASGGTLTNTSAKSAIFASPHYTNAEIPVGISFSSNGSTQNSLYFGGGTSFVTAATNIGFYTATTNTTSAGTERLSISSTGNVGIGSTTPSSKLVVSGQIIAANIISTTTASSTFAGALQTDYLNVLSTSATSTFANGINITGGCFAIGDSCIGVGTGLGTVTSVAATVPTGLTVTGSPITNSGTLAFDLAAGYVIPLTASTTEWAHAYASTSALTASGPLAYNRFTGALSLGTVGIANGGTNNTTYSPFNLLWFDGTSITSTTTNLTVGSINATGTATSTFAGGINIASGCLAVNGVCVSGSGGSGTVTTGIGGQVAFYSTSTNTVIGTSTLIISNENVGIGTSSPYSKLSVNGQVVATNYVATSTTATSTFFGGLTAGSNSRFTVLQTGQVGIGNASPAYALQVNQGSLVTAVFGADASGFTLTNASVKNARLGGAHYLNASQPVALIFSSSASTQNFVRIGGGSGSFMSAATDVQFYTAANTTTSDGTLRMSISSTGNVGIGTSTPGAKLSVGSGDAIIDGFLRSSYVISTSSIATSTFGGAVVIGSSTNTFLGNNLFSVGWSSSLFAVSSTTGNVGVGTSTPWRKLSVSGTVAMSGLTALSGANGDALCLNPLNGEVIVNSGAQTCTVSSARFKHEIENLDIGGLDTINALRSVSFVYNGNNEERIGFIAEEVGEVDPRLIFTEKNGAPRGMRYEDMTAILTKAVQELDVRTATLDDEIITESFGQKIVAYLADKLVEIRELVVGTLRINDQVCVDDVCVTKEQFKDLLINAGGAATPNHDGDEQDEEHEGEEEPAPEENPEETPENSDGGEEVSEEGEEPEETEEPAPETEEEVTEPEEEEEPAETHESEPEAAPTE